MSVESETVYRLQCSGTCGMWLEYWGGGKWNRTKDKSNASTFETWDNANKEGAEADWFDGPQGEYAHCSCGYPAFAPHKPNCRINKPRLVPLCPPCRTAEEQPPKSVIKKTYLATVAGDPLLCEHGHQVAMQIEVKEA